MTSAPHNILATQRSFFTYARYISKFGMLKGTKNYLRNYFGKEEKLKINLPGLQDKVVLRNGTSDSQCFNQVFLEQDYEFNVGFDPKFIVDCGANIGLSSLFFHKKYPEATVIAIEPEESNFEMLKLNTKNYSNIKPLKNGIWNKTVNLEVKAESYKNDKWGFSLQETQKENADIIKAITLEDVMKKFNVDEIDILKMDIEGGEKEVFSSNYENWLPKTKVIMIELHDQDRKGCGKTFFETLFKYDFSMNQHHRGEIIMCRRN